MKLIVLDRDGVINLDSKDYIKSTQEWQPIPGSLKAISLLNSGNFTVSVATNQSGIARGLYTKQTMHAIHRKMRRWGRKENAEIDSIFYCPHGPDDGCTCRKPRPGLLEKIAKFYSYSLKNVIFVGDSVRDIQCAIHAGAKPVLVLTGNGAEAQADPIIMQHNVPIFADLLEFSKQITSNASKS